MSFEAFVYCFKDGEPVGVSSQAVRETFGPYLSEGGAFDWQLCYDEANCCDVMLSRNDSDKALLRGFTVFRPCGDIRFWDAMANVLRLGNLVLLFPADCPPLIADVKVATHLPPGMIESMGQPKCITSGNEILNILHAV